MEQTNGNLALLPVRQQPTLAEWDTEENLALLRQTYAKDLSNPEFALYIAHCRQLRLNPLTKQVQPLKFDGKTLSFHTTIHGLIAIAARSGTYAGMEAVVFDVKPCGDTLGAQHPNSASVTVYKLVGGQRCAFTAEVFWVERNRGMASWKSQPFTMLAKCAQAAVLRLGWEEVQGLYIEEEMPAQVVESAAPAKEAEHAFLPPSGKTWQVWCAEMAKETGLFDDKALYLEFLAETTGVPTDKKYSAQAYARAAHRLQEMLWAMREESADDAGAGKTIEADQAEIEAN